MAEKWCTAASEGEYGRGMMARLAEKIEGAAAAKFAKQIVPSDEV
jgi:hypothetical protein